MSRIKRILLQMYVAILAMIPTSIGVKLRYYGYRPLFKKVHGKFLIDSGVTIVGFENIELGKDVSIQKNTYLYAIDGQLKLGDRFFLGVQCQLCAVRGDITIGDNVMFGPNCILRPDNHRIVDVNIPMMDQGYETGEIIVEDDVWIATHCVILKDVTLKTGSVVAAGSVVNKDVDEYAVVGGSPARVLKYRNK